MQTHPPEHSAPARRSHMFVITHTACNDMHRSHSQATQRSPGNGTANIGGGVTLLQPCSEAFHAPTGLIYISIYTTTDTWAHHKHTRLSLLRALL